VIVPDFESETSKKILAVFQGKASLATTVKGANVAKSSVDLRPIAFIVATTVVPKTTTTTTSTTVPSVQIDQDTRGIVPPNDPSCEF
jgi:hypothetical protein